MPAGISGAASRRNCALTGRIIHRPFPLRPLLRTAAGPAPTFTYAGDFDSDTKADLLVIYAGSTTSPPFMRMLKGDGTGGFTAGADVPLGGPPVDALEGSDRVSA